VVNFVVDVLYAVIDPRLSRSAIAPQILLALWLYATLRGVGSARQLSRLVLEHDAYRWISGGVQVNHHSLSDFRVAHGAALDELLSTSVAALMSAGAVKLERVAQDGVRVRADAGAASFRRKASLQDNLELARARVRELKDQLDADPAQDSRRKTAAQQRAKREMEQRVQQALDRLPELEDIKRRNGGKAEARASTTDAEASVMKMADGGFRPAYNAQFASDCDAQVIVGVELSTSGSDMAQLAPMVEQVEQRVGQVPAQWLVDGGYPAHEQLDAVQHKTEVYAPVPEPRAVKDSEGKLAAADKHQPKPDDSPAVAQWRQRMAGDEAQEIYKLRAATAECVNAQARNRGLQRMIMRDNPCFEPRFDPCTRKCDVLAELGPLASHLDASIAATGMPVSCSQLSPWPRRMASTPAVATFGSARPRSTCCSGSKLQPPSAARTGWAPTAWAATSLAAAGGRAEQHPGGRDRGGHRPGLRRGAGLPGRRAARLGGRSW
jgi:transposase